MTEFEKYGIDPSNVYNCPNMTFEQLKEHYDKCGSSLSMCDTCAEYLRRVNYLKESQKPKPTLESLAFKYSSDKRFWHSYIPKYEELFQGMTVRRLLEIGIGFKDLMQPFLPPGVPYVHGSSLRMFAEYFPEAEIYACDIREDTLINEGRIHSMVCDQSFLADLNILMHWCDIEAVDLVIEDGSHRPEHQMFTASVIVPRMKPGAVYICEDCWPATGNAIVKELGGEFWQGEKGRDDGLVIIKK